MASQGRVHSVIALLVTAAAFLGAAIPLTFFGNEGGTGNPFSFRHDPWAMWGVLGGGALAMIVQASLVYLMMRHASVPSWSSAILPGMVGLMGGFGVNQAFIRLKALAPSMEPWTRRKEVAELAENIFCPVILSGFLAASLAGAASISLALRALTRVRKPAFGLPSWLALTLGLAACLAVVGVLFKDEPLDLVFLGPCTVLGVISVSIGAASQGASSDPPEARGQALGDTFLAALAAFVGLVAMAIFTVALSMRDGVVGLSYLAEEPMFWSRRMIAAGEYVQDLPWRGFVITLPLLVAIMAIILPWPVASLGFRAGQEGLALLVLGLKRSALGVSVIGLGALAMLGPIHVLAVRVARFASSLHVTPPVSVSLVELPVGANTDGCEGPVLEVGKTLSFEGQMLGSEEMLASDQAARVLFDSREKEFERARTVAVEPAIPAGHLVRLLVDRVTFGGWGVGRRKEVRWLALPAATDWPNLPPPFETIPRGPSCVDSGVCFRPNDHGTVVVHLSSQQWKLRSQGGEQTLLGSQEQREKAVRKAMARQVRLLVSADDEVPAGEVLRVMAMKGAYGSVCFVVTRP